MLQETDAVSESRVITGTTRARVIDRTYAGAAQEWARRFSNGYAPDLDTPIEVLRDAVVFQSLQARQLVIEAMSPLRDAA